jgi:hypothetical protein
LLILGVIFVVTDNISWSLLPIGGHVVVLDSDEKAIQELEKSLSKIKSDKRYRNAKIFLGGDFNPGDINWATGGTISGGRNKSGHSSDFMSGLTIMSTPPSFLSMSSFRSFLYILYW